MSLRCTQAEAPIKGTRQAEAPIKGAGQIHSDKKELKMPAGKDEVGANYDGPVLSGESSVELRRAKEAAELVERQGDVERYRDVEDYDAVLRWHCRLD